MPQGLENRPLFVVKNDPFFTQPIVLDEKDRHHLLRVMRANTNEIFSVTDNNGNLATVKIKERDPLIFDVLSVKTAERPAPITACLSLFQINRMEWAVQKLCELNIKAIQWVVSERCELKNLSGTKTARLKKIATEAQKQCGRAWPLEINPCIALKEFPFNTHDIYIVGATLSSAPKKIVSSSDQNTFIFIGPEGDYTAEEYQFFREHRAQFINLGEIILKSETAALVLATLLKYSTEG